MCQNPENVPPCPCCSDLLFSMFSGPVRDEICLTNPCSNSSTCNEMERACGITLPYISAVGDRCANTFARACTRTRTRTHAHTHTRTHAHTRTNAHAHKLTHRRTRAHAHEHKRTRKSALYRRSICLFCCVRACTYAAYVGADVRISRCAISGKQTRALRQLPLFAPPSLATFACTSLSVSFFHPLSLRWFKPPYFSVAQYKGC
jgi:hypothetical protein